MLRPDRACGLDTGQALRGGRGLAASPAQRSAAEAIRRLASCSRWFAGS